MNEIAYVFICHNEETSKKSLNLISDSNFYILFVGPDEICLDVDETKITVARNLMHNIENERTLLTFTAWYAICKNNLFHNFKYICLMEYDVAPSKNFAQSLLKTCLIKNPDVVSFASGNMCFYVDVNPMVINEFIKSKNINYDCKNTWFYTTNHCIKRNVLCDFVDWYYPDYLQIKKSDPQHLSWYHERLFSVFLFFKNYKVEVLNDVLIHKASNSHARFQKKK